MNEVAARAYPLLLCRQPPPIRPFSVGSFSLSSFLLPACHTLKIRHEIDGGACESDAHQHPPGGPARQSNLASNTAPHFRSRSTSCFSPYCMITLITSFPRNAQPFIASFPNALIYLHALRVAHLFFSYYLIFSSCNDDSPCRAPDPRSFLLGVAWFPLLGQPRSGS